MSLIGTTGEAAPETQFVRSTISASRPELLPTIAAMRAAGERAVTAIALVVFIAAAAVTLYFVQTMSGGMRMPGGWTMSMMLMRMGDQTALGAATLFTVMWLAMMVAMMLPSVLPMLLVYRRVLLFRGEHRCAPHLLLSGAGYFVVWTFVGAIAYACGLFLARVAMESELVSRLVPLASGVALIAGGAWQFTPWKFACLKHCRDPIHLLTRHLEGGLHGGFTFGAHHGAYCAGCCWGLMLMLLALGVMNLAAMIIIAALIAAEKLLAKGEAVARIVGSIGIIAGFYLAARALL